MPLTNHQFLLCSLSVAALLPIAHGEGFRNPPAGAFALGRAGGRYAQNDDPSTVVHNPANFVDFDTTQLSVGAGLDVHWSQLVFKQFIFTGGPDADLKAKGDGFGYGGNAGITWEFMPGHRIAATYRSPVKVEYDGMTKTSFAYGPFETS